MGGGCDSWELPPGMKGRVRWARVDVGEVTRSPVVLRPPPAVPCPAVCHEEERGEELREFLPGRVLLRLCLLELRASPTSLRPRFLSRRGRSALGGGAAGSGQRGSVNCRPISAMTAVWHLSVTVEVDPRPDGDRGRGADPVAPDAP